VERVFSAPAIVFKGKGWHSTDYGKGSGRKASVPSCPKAESCPSGACPAAKGD
jgi:predicted nucleic acid-binding Zn ribbon protein